MKPFASLLLLLFLLCLPAHAHLIGVAPQPDRRYGYRLVQLHPEVVRFNRETIGPASGWHDELRRLRLALPDVQIQMLVGVKRAPDDWDRFRAALAAEVRSLPQVDVWQCGNEIRNRGVSWHGSEQDYLDTLAVFREVVLSINPDARVLVAGQAASEVLAPWQPEWVAAVGDMTDGWDVHAVGAWEAREAVTRMRTLSNKPVRVSELTGTLGATRSRQAREMGELLEACAGAEAVMYFPFQDMRWRSPWWRNGLISVRGRQWAGFWEWKRLIAEDQGD